MRKSIVALAASAGVLVSASALAKSPDNIDGERGGIKWGPYVEVIGGAYMNDHLRQGVAGREHQLKLTRGLLGLDLSKDNWLSRIELVALGDEIKHVPGDRAYQDIYRNLGTDIYYYGEHSVREAWVGQGLSWGYWRVGRMTSLMGEPVTSDRFASASEAPHAVLMNTGLLNGGQIGWESDNGRFLVEGAIMGGRDRPCLGANCYLNGALDVNEKGNNTPVVEAKITLGPMKGMESYAGYHYNKVGSAVGSFNSGKHNDTRLTVGFSVDVFDSEHLTLKMAGEYNRFTVGLTTEGIQGESTPLESRDITRQGYYSVIDAALPRYKVTLRYTREEMDRLDARAWQEVAKFDEEHPVNEASESRNIFTLIKDFNSGFSLRAFYRQDNVPFLTNGDQELEDRAGVVFRYKAVI